ncbi:MAG TPA: hypothetical protein VK463_21465 [Desulfomonilaceae bacterium]|nr:hypothetical protein [Desulfomonilaceae bacterium]
MPSKSVELALECQRLSESCLYTSTSLFIWLKFLRATKVAFIAVPLLLGAFAGWKFLTSFDAQWVRVATALSAFIAGLLPSIYSALKIDDHIEECRHLAGEFKNLQDRLRQAALVSSKKPFSEFQEDVKPVMERLEKARSRSVTAPEWCFRRAKTKIKSGDYVFDIDVKSIDLENE